MDFINGKTVRDLWSERVALSGGETALLFEPSEGRERMVDYATLNDRIDRAARAFHDELGIEKGDTVGLHLPNCPEYLEVWYALLKLGAVSVHSNTNHTAREVNYTLDNSDAGVIITTPAYEDVIADAREGTGVETTVYARAADADTGDAPTLRGLTDGAAADLPAVSLDALDPAQIIFTSGTTSDPKGVVHTHANLVYAGERASKHTNLRPDDRMLTALPLFHVNAQSISALSTLTVGGTLVLLEEFVASTYVEQLRKHRATVTSLIGTQIRALIARPEQGTDADNDLREIFFAINITDEEKERFEERFDVPLLNGYGLSETMTIVSMAPNNGDRSWPSIGRPAFDREVHLVDEDGNEVPTGEMGEIAVDGERGRNLMQEYYQMPERTEEAFTEAGWLLTGDFGRFDEDGNLYFVDRKKNIIETRGENVSEAEVEGILEEHPGIAEAGVIGVPHELYGEAVKALVKLDDPDVTVEDVRAHAEANLAEFKRPAEIEIVDEFPRTSIGKIQKSVLREETE
jgi:crotonobetaine/carnitine-CoA ligase